ncbi:baseplate J/gp47 family protein [Undibacterium sp. Ren11W]|uniref:baseplate J/gp47 family protein n=1 Tax=Undibacterium sp. Ren11W TaxID=3413045 RepID=UPI003BF2E2C5
MSFSVKTFEQIRDGILRDIVNQNPQAVVGADSDFRLRANSSAAAVEGLYQYQAWMSRQIMPDTADDDILLQYASLYGLSLKPATAATGSIAFTGTPGVTINVGVESKSLDGQAYVTTASGNIAAGGSITLAAVASATGLVGNQAANTALTLTSAPAGVSSAALIVTMLSGSDIETSASLLSRLLDRLRHPPAGGNKFDYRRWALEVPGVSAAWCYPLRRGVGTADVAILSNGIPAPQVLQNTVRDYIETVNPAGGDCQVSTPTLVTINVVATVVLSGVVLADVQASVLNVLTAYIASLQPGDTVMRSRILASITDVSGVTDVNLTSPATSVVTLIDATHIQLATMGTVTLS